MALLTGACIVIGRALFHSCGLPDRLPVQQAGQVGNTPHQTAIDADRADRAIAQTSPLAASLFLPVQGMGSFSGCQEVAPGSNCGQSGRNLNLCGVKKIRHGHHLYAVALE